MVDVLRRGSEDHGFVSVKAEFEAEGTRIDDLLRLVEITRKAGVPLTVKIGGCEAIRDLLEAKQIGVQSIVAPMVESPYAATKFIAAKNQVYSEDEQADTTFLFNVETQLAVDALPSLLEVGSRVWGVQGVVLGRVDLSGSLGLTRDDVNGGDITELVLKSAALVKSSGLDFVVGGGISIEAIPVLRRVANSYMSRFETRKVIFAAGALEGSKVEQGLKNAIRFELLWLKNKRDYYSGIASEDQHRIRMLESRWSFDA